MPLSDAAAGLLGAVLKEREALVDRATDKVFFESSDLHGKRSRLVTRMLVDRVFGCSEGVLLRGEEAELDVFIDQVTGIRAEADFHVSTLIFGFRSFRHAIEESAQSLSREELAMINRILDLQNLRVRDVMTPMERAVSFDADATLDQFLARMRERSVSYVPVWNMRATPRRVLGVVSLNAILLGEPPDLTRPLSGLVQPALFVDDTTRLEDALRLMQRGRQRLAVVLNPKRVEIGVVTLNDILTAMFGEVRV